MQRDYPVVIARSLKDIWGPRRVCRVRRTLRRVAESVRNLFSRAMDAAEYTNLGRVCKSFFSPPWALGWLDNPPCWERGQ